MTSVHQLGSGGRGRTAAAELAALAGAGCSGTRIQT